MTAKVRGILLSIVSLSLMSAFGWELRAVQSSATISGTVFDVQSGRPLAGVALYILPPDRSLSATSKSVLSNSSGQFLFDGVAPGRYRIVPKLQGWVYSRPEGLRTPQPGPLLQVNGNDRRTDVDLRLGLQAVISGQVVDTSGRPAVDFLVRLVRSAGQSSEDQPFANVNSVEPLLTKTDDRGQFRFSALQAADYYLQVSRGAGVLPAFAYYPGVVEQGRATAITTRLGEEVRLSAMAVETPKRVPVRLYFADTEKRGVLKSLNYGPTDSPRDSMREVYSVNRSGGSQEIVTAWAPGHYEVLLVITSDREETYYSRTSVEVGDREINQEIALLPAYQVKGRFIDEAQGIPLVSMGQAGCVLVPQSLSDGMQAYNGCEGQFSPGRYRLEFHDLSEDAYVSSVTTSGKDILSDGFEIRGDTSFDIVMGRDGGVVSGVVRDGMGKPLGEASVTLVPDGARAAAAFYKTTLSNFDGSFEIRGIAPGDYLLYSWQDLDRVAYRDADFMKAYVGRGVPTKMAKGQRESVNLTALED